MAQYNLLFTQHVEDPVRTSEVALEAIRSVSRRVINYETITFLSIRLLPEHAMELIPSMPTHIQEFLATLLDIDTIVREYRDLDPNLLYIAIISQKEPLSPDVIISLMNMINGYNKEKIYYAALDRYLLKHGMSEIEFLRRFDPRGSRLKKILSMYPDENIVFNRDIEYTNTDSIGGISIDAVHDDQLWVDENMYAFPSADLVNMARDRRYNNPFTSSGYYRSSRNRFLTDMARRRIPMIRSGAVEYHEPPLEYEHTKSFHDDVGIAVNYGHDMRWYITLKYRVVQRAAILLGGYCYIAKDKNGYKFRPMDTADVVADVGEYIDGDRSAPAVTRMYMVEEHTRAMSEI